MAAAGHMDKRTRTCDYEFAGTGDHWENTIVDPFGPDVPPDEVPNTPVTDDGSFNFSGCLFEFVDTNPGLDKSIQNQPFILIEQGYPVGEDDGEPNSEWEKMQVEIDDDTFNNEIGGFACGDLDANYVCGEEEKGELLNFFCGGFSPIFNPGENNANISGDGDGDGHQDTGWQLAVFVNGPSRENGIETGCPENTNPIGGTSGGLTTNDGGVSLHLLP